MRGRDWAAAAFALLSCGLVAAARLGVPGDEYGDLSTAAGLRWIMFELGAGAAFLLAVALVWSGAAARPVLLAGLAAGLAARLVLLATPPVMSTDLYRYVWDGRVQRAGINPYRFIPADPALGFLRDGRTGPEAVFININRPETARTIYPPGAQALFAAIGATWSSIWAVKVAMLVFDLLAGWAAWRLLRLAGRPDAWLLAWAVNPAAITELAGAGHIDAAAAGLSALALLLAAQRRALGAGAALGLAILCKLLPLALAPAIWRPRGWRAPVAAAAIVAGFYAAYASVGPAVLGYLPGYAQEEKLDAGGGIVWLRLLALAGALPRWAGPAYLLAGLLLLAALALAVLARPGPPRAAGLCRAAAMLSVALMLTLSPHYPWYLVLTIVPAAVARSWGALWMTAAGPLLYLDSGLDRPWWPAVVFVPALVWLFSEPWKRTEHA